MRREPGASPGPIRRVGFALENKASAPPRAGGREAAAPGKPEACISSRITTVIQVVNPGPETGPRDGCSVKGILTDLMSHSQFHRKAGRILTHAWLNL